MARGEPNRSGIGVTTSDSMMGRGPRCMKCGAFVAATYKNANGDQVCWDCGGERLSGGLIRVVDGPGDDFEDEDYEDE